MSDEATPEGEERKRSRLPVVAGLLLALLGGGGGYYLGWSGWLSLTPSREGAAATPGAADPVAFVTVEPVDVAFGQAGAKRRFRFTCALEVNEADAAAIAQLMPRIRDVLNSYLNAVTPEDVDDPAAITRIRAHLLRRIQIVTGSYRVRDLLVTEFILT